MTTEEFDHRMEEAKRRERELFGISLFAREFKGRLAGLGVSPEGQEALLDKAIAYTKLGLSACESPIEKDIVQPLVFAEWPGFGTVPAPIYLPDSDYPAPAGDIVIIPQMKFGRYRADFAVLAKHDDHTKWFVVECDGAEFHMDQGKDQARDSYFRALGISLIRLTGRQIKSGPYGAIERVLLVVGAWKADQR